MRQFSLIVVIVNTRGPYSNAVTNPELMEMLRKGMEKSKQVQEELFLKMLEEEEEREEQEKRKKEKKKKKKKKNAQQQQEEEKDGIENQNRDSDDEEKKIKKKKKKKKKNNDNNRDEKEETTSAWTNTNNTALFEDDSAAFEIVTSKKKKQQQQQQQQSETAFSSFDTSAVAARAATESVCSRACLDYFLQNEYKYECLLHNRCFNYATMVRTRKTRVRETSSICRSRSDTRTRVGVKSGIFERVSIRRCRRPRGCIRGSSQAQITIDSKTNHRTTRREYDGTS